MQNFVVETKSSTSSFKFVLFHIFTYPMFDKKSCPDLYPTSKLSAYSISFLNHVLIHILMVRLIFQIYQILILAEWLLITAA